MEQQTPTRSPRPRLSSPAGLLALGIALLVLLGVVAAASRVHHTPGGHAGIHQPPSGVGDYVFSIFAVMMASAALFLFYLWFSERDLLVQARRRKQSKGSYKAIVLLLLLGLLVALLARWGIRFDFFRHRAQQQGLVHKGKSPSSKKQANGPNAERAPQFEWLPVVIATAAGTALLGYIGLRTLRRSRGDLAREFALEQQLESLLDDTLDDLYAQKDARVAIIAAYARMEQIFEASGLPRRPAEAPMEYLGRALGELSATGAALGRLTGLFQWAKFSSHQVDDSMRDEAIGALTEVRDELRSKRAEDALRRAEAQKFERERRGKLATEPADERTFGDDPFAAAEEKMRGSFEGTRGL